MKCPICHRDDVNCECALQDFYAVYDAAMAEFEAECNGDDAAWDAAHEILLDACRRAKGER